MAGLRQQENTSKSNQHDIGRKRAGRKHGKVLVAFIYKKEDSSELGNYRPISLLQIFYKMIAALIKERIGARLDDWIHETQHGFRTKKRITAETTLPPNLRGKDVTCRCPPGEVPTETPKQIKMNKEQTKRARMRIAPGILFPGASAYDG